MSAPFIPFLSDAIYQELRREEDPLSVHLLDFPKANDALRDKELEKEMALVQSVVSAGHALRKEHKLKVRQPLAHAHMVSSDDEVLVALKRQEHLIADELNVKEVSYHKDESAFVELVAKPNFRVLGKKVGKKMNAVHKQVLALGREALTDLLEGKEVVIEVEGEKITLEGEDINVERKVLDGVAANSSGGLTVAIDTALTPELVQEGLARELVNKINFMRKEQGFAVTDRIHLEMAGPNAIEECFKEHGKYILKEELALDVAFKESVEGTPSDLNGEEVTISIRR